MMNLNALPWIGLQNFVNAMTYIKRSPYLSSVNQPDRIKTYPDKGHLFASRIFLPSDQKSKPSTAKTRTSTEKLPLVIRIHGGGFIMNSPAADDALARFLADTARCIVISMDYSKAPRHTFPAAYEDLVALTLAAIEDDEIPVDADRVVLCGSSSGGNLALAIAQDVRLRGKLRGVIGFTPVVDLVTPLERKIATRPDPSVPDFLAGRYENIVGLYVGGKEVSFEDVRLSPCRFERRGHLPRYVYIVAVEHDLLAREAEDMAEKLAGGSEKQKTEKGWRAGDVQWDFVRGQKHAFENFPAKEKEAEAARLVAVDWAWQAMADWLVEVFGRSS